MAITHLQINDQTQHGRQLRQITNAIDTIMQLMPQMQATLQDMITGDGSTEAQFVEMASRLGTSAPADNSMTANAVAMGVWNEFNSAWSKISGDGSVTTVNTALKQFTNKLR